MEIRKICVLGAGVMGHGIAQVAAQGGYNVTLRDIDEGFVQRGLTNIRKNLERMVKAGKMEMSQVEQTIGRIKTSTDMTVAARDAQVVIEAIPENLDLKKKTFRELEEICSPETILASNTSQLSITSIASATRDRKRIIGMHWFNPPPVMRLIEVIRGVDTAEGTVEIIRDLAIKLGKDPVICVDSQGFIVTRALSAFLMECTKILEEGVASKEDIDKAIKLGLNHPMGPFELADYIGLDTQLYIFNGLEDTFGGRFKSTQTLRKLVAAGYFGRKTGRGFYDYGQ